MSCEESGMPAKQGRRGHRRTSSGNASPRVPRRAVPCTRARHAINRHRRNGPQEPKSSSRNASRNRRAFASFRPFARNCRVRSYVPTSKWRLLDYFRGSAMTTIAAFCRVYGWEEKKTKASWGSMTVDYEAIAGNAVRENECAGHSEISHRLCSCFRPLLSGLQSAPSIG